MLSSLFIPPLAGEMEIIMKILSLDVGDKTIGIAASDPLEMIATGIMTLERTNIKKDCGKIIDIVLRNECKRIVIGLPKMLDGSESLQTEKVKSFKEKLENKIKAQKVDADIVFFDERFTTKIAEQVLISADISRKKRKEVIDKQAAVIILQGYLEEKRGKDI